MSTDALASNPLRVLVTGASTPLGRALVKRLLQTANVETILCACASSEDDVARTFRDEPRVHAIRCDLRRERDVRSMLFGPARAHKINAVVDGARHRSIDAEGPRVRALNVEATRELLHLCERHESVRHYLLVSSAAVYRADGSSADVVDEEHPLDFRPEAPQWRRDRVEVDVSACVRMGMSPLRITVLRMAELFAEDSGSQLWDYLRTRVCLRPMGYDPMLELLTIDDAARAIALALTSRAQGIFNVRGRDVLPLSTLIARAGRDEIALPGPMLAPLYALRRRVTRLSFRYDVNRERLHNNCVLDGRRALRELGYEPVERVDFGAVPPPI
ncbi:MAG: SDR family oxidoreductase [Polyangiales bacterium]